MDRPFRSPTGWQQTLDRPTPSWQGKEPAPEPPNQGSRPRPGTGFDRFRVPMYRGAKTQNVNVYLAEIDKLRRLVEGPDDSWLDHLSKSELIALRDRARALAGTLSKVQDQLKPLKRY